MKLDSLQDSDPTMCCRYVVVVVVVVVVAVVVVVVPNTYTEKFLFSISFLTTPSATQ